MTPTGVASATRDPVIFLIGHRQPAFAELAIESKVIIIGYMIQDRDSFHGWWKDKPDTQFSGMNPLQQRPPVRRASGVWFRAGVILVLMFMFVLALKSLLGR